MILICRHGETQWNIQQRKQGRQDSPLTLNGIKQGSMLAKELDGFITSDSPIILCSPLCRTKQYASIICDTVGIPYSLIEFDDRLKEHSFGEWEGLNEVQIEELYPGMVKAREASWWDYEVPGGESYALLERRLTPFVEGLNICEDYVIIAHEMVSKVLRKILLGLSEQECLSLKHDHGAIMQINKNKLSEINFQ